MSTHKIPPMLPEGYTYVGKGRKFSDLDRPNYYDQLSKKSKPSDWLCFTIGSDAWTEWSNCINVSKAPEISAPTTHYAVKKDIFLDILMNQTLEEEEELILI